MRTARLMQIVKVNDEVYCASLRAESGELLEYEFRVVEYPIRTVTWTELFEEEIGTLTAPGQRILEAVYKFHEVVQLDVPLRGRLG